MFFIFIIFQNHFKRSLFLIETIFVACFFIRCSFPPKEYTIFSLSIHLIRLKRDEKRQLMASSRNNNNDDDPLSHIIHATLINSCRRCAGSFVVILQPQRNSSTNICNKWKTGRLHYISMQNQQKRKLKLNWHFKRTQCSHRHKKTYLRMPRRKCGAQVSVELSGIAQHEWECESNGFFNPISAFPVDGYISVRINVFSVWSACDIFHWKDCPKSIKA